MIKSALWQRYILKQFLKSFFFLFVQRLSFICMLDYCSHAQDFLHGKKIYFHQIAYYYAFHFFKRSELLFPLALLISTIHVLVQLTTHFELLAFQTAGLSLRKLISPLVKVAFICTFVSITIAECFLPLSLNYIDKFYDTYFRHSFRGNRKEPLHVLYLEDRSKFIYQFYDASTESFFDVIWVKSANDLWRIKYLKADPQNPVALFADHLERKPHGFEKTASFPEILLEDLKWEKDLPRKGLIPFENRSISQLLSLSLKKGKLFSYEKAEILSHLLFKTLMPFLCVLSVIAIAPFCVRYSRHFSSFLLYSIALFAFVIFCMFMDALLILGENGAFSPFIALGAPFIFCFGFFSYKYLRLGRI